MRNWFFALAAGTLATAMPALADPVPIVNGMQFIITFDDLDVGTGDFGFNPFGDPGFRNNIFGGIVTEGTPPDDPAISVPNVYRGMSIGFDLDDPFNYCWPAIGAYVTNNAPVRLTVYIYDYDLQKDVFAGTTVLPGGMTNFYFGIGSELNPGVITKALFESSQPFSLDNLTFGLEDVAPGVPETETWALMIAGFGIAGAMLRRRRISVSAMA